MKLVIAIVQDEDASRVTQELMKSKFRATKLASTGGFLKSGNTTLLIGVEDDKLDDALGIVEGVCKSRKIKKGSKEVEVGGATVFVMNTGQFKKI